jgi:predicted esterase
MESHSIEAVVHGRYLLDVPASGGASGLLVGFHGYGENAERHMDELRRIPGLSGWALCAVQALHPFYNRAGEVIASWMTKLDRELAITDNVAYAAEVVTAVRRVVPVAPLAFLGFSQGAAMAYRAAAASGHSSHGLVVLGGDLPPELDDRQLAGLPPILLGRGESEEWYDAAKMEHDVLLLRGKGAEVRPVVFRGGHEWTDEFRGAAAIFLREVCQPAS